MSDAQFIYPLEASSSVVYEPTCTDQPDEGISGSIWGVLFPLLNRLIQKVDLECFERVVECTTIFVWETEVKFSCFFSVSIC